jgi:hypothetical protein
MMGFPAVPAEDVEDFVEQFLGNLRDAPEPVVHFCVTAITAMARMDFFDYDFALRPLPEVYGIRMTGGAAGLTSRELLKESKRIYSLAMEAYGVDSATPGVEERPAHAFSPKGRKVILAAFAGHGGSMAKAGERADALAISGILKRCESYAGRLPGEVLAAYYNQACRIGERSAGILGESLKEQFSATKKALREAGVTEGLNDVPCVLSSPTSDAIARIMAREHLEYLR